MLFIELAAVLGGWKLAPGAGQLRMSPVPSGGMSNTEALGRILYTDYVFLFQTAGLVLLVAMIGAIVLTLRHKPGVRRQIVADQVLRTPRTGMRLVDLKPGQGIDQ